MYVVIWDVAIIIMSGCSVTANITWSCHYVTCVNQALLLLRNIVFILFNSWIKTRGRVVMQEDPEQYQMKWLRYM